MRKPHRLTQLIVAVLAVFSMVATTTPASANVTSGIHIVTKKKTLSKEAKAAKAAVAKAEKVLKAKENSLKSAAKALAKAQKNLDKARKKAGLAPSSLLPLKASTKAMKVVVSAQRTRDRAAALVDSRTRARDKAQADLTKKQAKYAWLVQDLTAMDCGAGTQITNANGAVETVQECGIVYDINDGDTVWVKTTKNEIVEVRNIGLQTPELKKQSGYAEQCGATAAKNNMLTMLTPEVSVVQLRSITAVDNKWGGFRRPERSIWALNPTTGLFDIDVQAAQMKAGLSFYWPSSREWTHNKEYLGYLLEARAAGVGIWNPAFCGADYPVAPTMYLNANAPTIGGDVEPAFGEYVMLKNETGSDLNIGGWSLRDGSLDFFSLNGNWEFDKSKFPAGTVIPAGGVLTVYLSNPNGYTIADAANEKVYFTWRSPGAQIANGSLGTSTIPEFAHGDGVYLLDPKGNVRASMLSVCSTTVLTCDKPAWVSELQTTSASHIIPWPVSLSLVRNDMRDTYNPVMSLSTSIAATKSHWSSASNGSFTFAADTSVNGSQAAGTQVGIAVAGSTTNMVGSRVPVAQLPGNTVRTQLTVLVASGQNAVPSVINMTRQAAHDTLVAAGFANTLTGDPAAIVTSEPTLTAPCTQSSCAVGTTITVP